MNTIETMPELELLSLEEAAEFLCVSKSTMYRLLDQRKLTGMKAGKQWRFRKEDLLAYMQRGPAAQALARVPMPVLDAELDFFAGELEKAGITTADSDDPALEGEEGKITQLVRRMAWLLHRLRGSDIHLNPVWTPDGPYGLVLYRVDGALIELRRMPPALLDALVLEWKRLANMSVEEDMRPLDGTAQIAYGQQLLMLRVATIPTLYGEKVSVRTLPTRVPTMADLTLEQTPLMEWSHRQHGLFLIVGPTGCGKTTTRAACMQEIISSKKCNVFTVEDPVEYVFPQGVTHLKVEQFSRADGLRALLRHDPDVIVLGEIQKDPELVQLAVEAAETGHLVMTVMHANDAMTPVFDFIEWGVKRTLLANNLIGIAYQVLMPKRCEACMAKVEVEPDILEKIRQTSLDGGYRVPDDAVFLQPTGCEACRGTGNTGGRVVRHEFITFTPAIRSALRRCTTIEEFTRAVREDGQLSFFAELVKRSAEGATSLDTLLRYLPY